MHKTTCLIMVLVFFNTLVFGQNSELDQPTFFDNVRFGGNVSMSFGNSYSSFSITPSAIYDFSPQFGAGFGLTYMYYKKKSSTDETTNIYGGSIISLYKPLKYLQFSTEYEQLKLKKKFTTEEFNSDWQSAFYIGVEYVTGVLSMGLRYDILYDEKDNLLHSSALTPVFRVYF